MLKTRKSERKGLVFSLAIHYLFCTRSLKTHHNNCSFSVCFIATTYSQEDEDLLKGNDLSLSLLSLIYRAIEHQKGDLI